MNYVWVNVVLLDIKFPLCNMKMFFLHNELIGWKWPLCTFYLTNYFIVSNMMFFLSLLRCKTFSDLLIIYLWITAPIEFAYQKLISSAHKLLWICLCCSHINNVTTLQHWSAVKHLDRVAFGNIYKLKIHLHFSNIGMDWLI